MACVMAKDREGWLALWAEDGCVEDPVGISFLDPTGEGHTGHDAIGRFFDANIGILTKVEFDIRHSYSTGLEVANVGTIHLHLPDGAIGHCEGVFVYRVREDGKLVSLRAFWEVGAMMAAMEPAPA